MSLKLRSLSAALLLLLPAGSSLAQEPAAAAPLIIDPSSTSLAGGNVKLSTSTLNRRAQTFGGDYQIRVMPYFFKNEKGSLVISVPDSSLRKLTKGVALEFAGKAITSATGEQHPVHVRATSVGDGRGDLTISIKTENGNLVFNTVYRFGDT